LLLEDEAANADGIAGLLSHCPQLQLAVLNGCSTYQQVEQLLAGGLPAVIATSAAVGDDAATRFAIVFYQSLAEKNSTLKDAFNFAIAATRMKGEVPLVIETRAGRPTAVGEAGWGLYYRDEAVLAWKLPSVAMTAQTIIIKGTTEDAIRLEIGGEIQEIRRNLEDLHSLLKQQQTQRVQTADKIYNIGSITHANFDFIVGQSNWNQALPSDLAEDLITDEALWVESLRREFKGRRITVGTGAVDIFKHYGWLIEAFLHKINTKPGRERKLRRLSFMAEAFQSSLRYLCYIQLSILFKYAGPGRIEKLADFAGMPAEEEAGYDYLDLLLRVTELLPERGREFMPELLELVDEIKSSESSVQTTVLFLTKYRNDLLRQAVIEDDAFSHLLDEYLTALVFWLRQLAFLAKYRLVSIKNISVDYRLGSSKSFEHQYGELHGMFADKKQDGQRDFVTTIVEDVFTYNQSVLLFKGKDIDRCLENIHDPDTYISLSPLVIDQSVYSEKPTQTPEIFYYAGRESDRSYRLAYYKNELAYEDKPLHSNKQLNVKEHNSKDPLLDDLFSHLSKIFQPLSTSRL
jgi:hypothetical protein